MRTTPSKCRDQRAPRRAISLLAVATAIGTVAAVGVTRADTPGLAVTIHVDAAHRLGPLLPIWRFFGADEPNYATMKDGRKLLAALGELRRGDVYFRAHNLLTSGDGTPAFKWGSTNAYSEDSQGRPLDDWTIVDRIFDAYRERGVRPYVEVGFMPKALSAAPEPYQHDWRPGLPFHNLFTGWAHPPSDYRKWGELVRRWVEHCVDRYGRREVESWYFETWNEANIGYWQGSRDEFLKLHDFAIDGVRRALPTARVGGPDMAGSDPTFLRAFLDHCLHGTNQAGGGVGTPLDFVAFHAKGAPTTVDGHVRMGIAAHLRTIDGGFATIASYPELRRTPIVIGESDPEGCAACQGPQLAYRNGTMYSSYTAASFPRVLDLAERHGVALEGVLTWAFEFEDQPLFPGFRALATNGLALPVLNAFRLFSRLSGERIAASSTGAVDLDTLLARGVRDAPDVAALASRDGDRVAVLVWHYHDDDVPGPEADVTLELAGLPPSGALQWRHYRIDENHSNAYAAWQRMGAPAPLSREQYGALEAASQLAELEPMTPTAGKGAATLRFTLPRQAVSLLVFDGPARGFQADPPIRCDSCDAWNAPQEPFRVFGNTYSVGVAGLSAVLIRSERGLVLLDGGLPQSAPLIDASIRKLGFRTEDVRLIVNSHAHYDHAGGIAALQRASGAVVAASPSGARAIETGRLPADDPQYAGAQAGAFPAAKPVRVVKDGETLRLGDLALTAHLTPGHTPGSTTWSWRSCEGSRCLDVVYGDSLNAISSPGFRFSGDAKRPSVEAAFRRSIASVGDLPCDVLLTVHPGFVDIAGKLRRRAAQPDVNPFIDSNACRAYAADALRRFEQRLAEEKKE